MTALEFIIIYISVAIFTNYWFRFTQLYRNNHGLWPGDDALCFVVIVWPVGYIVLAVYFVIKFCRRSHMTNPFILADKIIEQIFKRKVHSDKFGDLYRMPSPYAATKMMVKVKDSTGTYWLEVPPNVKTAKEAVAWTYSMEEKNFDPIRI